MDHDVRTDAELLGWFCDYTPVVTDRVTGRRLVVSAKLLAAWTGKSLQMVSQYRSGTTNIPVEFWQRILDHHVDRRIIALMVPSDLTFEIVDARCNMPASPKEFFKDAVAAEIAYHDQMKHVAEILADGQVDELDADTVQAYADAFEIHRLRDAALHHAIVNTFNRAQERQAVPRE